LSIKLSCSHCQATLTADESRAGRRAKCPKCGGAIVIPAAPANPGEEEVLEPELGSLIDDGAGEYELEAPPPPPPQRETRKPCPECGEMIMREAVKCRFCGAVLDKSLVKMIGGKTGASDPGWLKVRSGLSLMYNGIVAVFIAMIVVVIAAIAIGGMEMRGGPGADPPAGVMVVIGIGGLVLIIAGICVLVGQAKCTNVPDDSGAKGFATGAIICTAGNIIASMAGGASQQQAIAAVGNLLGLIGYVLFVLFIRRAARALGDDELEASAGRFLAFGVLLFVGAILLGVLSGMARAPVLMGILGIVILVSVLVGFIWYLRLLKGLMTTIDAQVGA
jgi:predicted RNA-binding Zn-ribbon protein involved in translation (DUF1610 family)